MISIHSPTGNRRRIPLTPLIDVIFILVMFFLLSSTFGVWRPLDVSLGAEGAEETAAQPPAGAPAVLVLVRADQGNGVTRISVNGLDVPLDGLAGELNRLADRGAEDAVLVPARGTSFQQVVRILDEARLSEIKRVSLKLD